MYLSIILIPDLEINIKTVATILQLNCLMVISVSIC